MIPRWIESLRQKTPHRRHKGKGRPRYTGSRRDHPVLSPASPFRQNSGISTAVQRCAKVFIPCMLHVPVCRVSRRFIPLMEKRPGGRSVARLAFPHRLTELIVVIPQQHHLFRNSVQTFLRVQDLPAVSLFQPRVRNGNVHCKGRVHENCQRYRHAGKKPQEEYHQDENGIRSERAGLSPLFDRHDENVEQTWRLPPPGSLLRHHLP